MNDNTNPTAAQPLDLDKILPCPFCGGTETFVERLDYSAAYVQCDSRIDQHSACLARGPVGVQDDDGEEIPGAAAAIRAWNNQAALIAHACASQPESATGTTGASQSIDSDKFRSLIEAWAATEIYPDVSHGPYAALVAHIDAIISDLRAQLAAKGQDEAFRDAVSYGTGVLQDGKHIPYADLYATPASAQPTDDDCYCGGFGDVHNHGCPEASAQPDRGAAPPNGTQTTPNKPKSENAAPSPSSQPVAPKVARDWPEDASHENGNYQCICYECGNTFIGHKRRVTCKGCAAPSAVAPSDAKGKADAANAGGLTLTDCVACNGHGCTHYPDGEWQGKCTACKGTGIDYTSAADAKDAAPDMRHPIQPLAVDDHGRIRFKRNHIVEYLAEGKLNDLAEMGFPQEDWEQLAQLIGYSLHGFGTLSYVTNETYDRAAAMAAAPSGEIGGVK